MSKQSTHEHRDNIRPALTKNQNLVFQALINANVPLSAYSILDQLRGDGLKAPLQIYRALETLITNGFVHRLESLNAFIACGDIQCGNHGIVTFMICHDCGNVQEINNAALVDQLAVLSSEYKFKLSHSTIELRGTCADCA